jgi:hypothetical protein
MTKTQPARKRLTVREGIRTGAPIQYLGRDGNWHRTKMVGRLSPGVQYRVDPSFDMYRG